MENKSKKKNSKNLSECCGTKKEYNGNNPLMGIVYGVVPHIGCIAFVIASILGVTILMQAFKPILMNRYIFHYLIILSLCFATISSFLYLKKNKLMSIEGVKAKRNYLFIMYGSTLIINGLFFFVIFPLLTNVSLVGATEFIGNPQNIETIDLSVNIPCPGHAPLISNELKAISGVVSVKYSFPNNFRVQYDKTKTSIEEILSPEVFDEYPAKIISTSSSDLSNTQLSELSAELIETNTQYEAQKTSSTCAGGCGGTGTCGGGCGSPPCTLNK
jgi:copper chaperone CopZ